MCNKTLLKKFEYFYIMFIEMPKVMPFLLFDGNCAEAMRFYQNYLGGELTLTKLGDTPMKSQFTPEKYNRIINAHLKSGEIEISASD